MYNRRIAAQARQDQMLQNDSVYSFVGVPIVFQSSDPQPEALTDVIDQGQLQGGHVQQKVRQENMEFHGAQEDQYQETQKLPREFPERHDRKTQVRALQVVQDLLQACQPQDLSEINCHSPVQDTQVLSGHCGDQEDKKNMIVVELIIIQTIFQISINSLLFRRHHGSLKMMNC